MRLTLSTTECERVLRGLVDRTLTWGCFKGRLIQRGPKEGLDDLLVRACVHAVTSLLVAAALRDVMLPLNRDKNGATNIGTNFMRLFEDKTPVRSMSDEDLAFHRASLCLECE